MSHCFNGIVGHAIKFRRYSEEALWSRFSRFSGVSIILFSPLVLRDICSGSFLRRYRFFLLYTLSHDTCQIMAHA